MNIEFFALSDIGRVRKENQDNYIVIDNNENGFLCAVFDGVGGCDDGKYASEFLRSIIETYYFRTDYFYRKDVFIQQEKFLELIRKMNSDILEEGERLGKRLFSTMSFLFLQDDFYYIGHIGDSRIYNIRDNNLFRLTKDDNPEKGNTNILLQAMGTSADIEPHVYFENIFEGDYFLLCSDGLTNYTDEKTILDKICSDKAVDEKVIDLIENSLSEGGKDNITAILVKIS